jgi:hypothetical protein
LANSDTALAISNPYSVNTDDNNGEVGTGPFKLQRKAKRRCWNNSGYSQWMRGSW